MLALLKRLQSILMLNVNKTSPMTKAAISSENQSQVTTQRRQRDFDYTTISDRLGWKILFRGICPLFNNPMIFKRGQNFPTESIQIKRFCTGTMSYWIFHILGINYIPMLAYDAIQSKYFSYSIRILNEKLVEKLLSHWATLFFFQQSSLVGIPLYSWHGWTPQSEWLKHKRSNGV